MPESQESMCAKLSARAASKGWSRLHYGKKYLNLRNGLGPQAVHLSSQGRPGGRG